MPSGIRKDTGKFATRLRLAVLHPKVVLRRVFGGYSVFTEVPWATILSLLPEQGAIVEAGAADGLDTVTLAKLFPQRTVVACEPVPDSYSLLSTRAEKYTNITAIEVALAEQDGTATLNLGRSHPSGPADSSSLLTPSKHLTVWPGVLFDSTCDVSTRNLDSLIEELAIKPDFLWLDMQGAELAVLASAPNARVNLVAVYMEVSRVSLYEGMSTYREVVKQMKLWGFSIVRDQVGLVSGNILFSKIAG